MINRKLLNCDTIPHQVIMTTVHFFDKTPLGVILNRFSADVVCCDSSLPG